ncbi:MAG: dentilisin complex serine proteinase subunit PrtP [Treponema sp.]
MKISKRLFFVLLVFLAFLSCKQKMELGGNSQIPDIKRPEDTCRVNILNQVNGSYAKDLRLTISESGSNDAIFDEDCPYGVAFPKLEVGKCYDFEVAGNNFHSGSYIKNLKIKTTTDDISIVCLFKTQKTREATTLKLREFKFIKKGGTAVDVVDGLRVETPIKGEFLAKVSSSSGAIYESIANGFAGKLGLGKVPSSSSNPKQDIIGAFAAYPKVEAGEWVSEIHFLLGDNGSWESFTREEQDLITVFYDATGNRLETHNYIVCEPRIANFQKYEGDDYKLTDFYVETRTYSAYNEIYSVANSDGEDVHYAPVIFFSVKDKNMQPAKIVAVEVFRREAIKEGNGEFAHVFTSSFKNPQEDIRESGSSPIPFIKDRTGTFEVNKEYEYKAKIYTQNGYYFETNVAKCKILPQYKVYLSKPAQHASLLMPARYAPFDAVLKDFAVRVSDASLWDAKKSDYFTCGLVINTFRYAEIYRMLFRYHFNYNETGKEELEFLLSHNDEMIKATLTELKQRKIIPYYIEVKDFVEWDSATSSVIMKKEMLTTRVFNIADRWDTLKDGEIYYWDVFGVSGKLPDDKRMIGKQPPSFTKIYKNEDGVASYSSTYGAGFSLIANSSANGKFDFTVKSENELTNSSLSMRPYMEYVVEGSYVVKADESFENAKLPNGAKILGKMSVENGLSWYCVVCDEGKDILFSLLKMEGVRNADYQHKMTFPEERDEKETVLSTFSFDDNAVFKGTGYSLEITDALRAYEELEFGSEPVLVGIMDSGVFLGHEDLKGADGKSIIKDYFVQNWRDLGDGKLAPNGWKSSNTDTDENGHGTHCVGVMAAPADNGKGIAGVSGKNTKVVVYRGLYDTVDKNGQASEFYSMDAIRKFTDYVIKMRKNKELNQACVPINLSVGTPVPSPLANEVINYALANGVLPVAAMSNNGLRMPSYPAAYKGVVAVGSSNGSDKVSSYSNKGEWISIVAPGENIISLYHKHPQVYVSMNGTSMATPFVSGAVAYLAGLNPEITPQNMKSILEKTADKIEGTEDFNIRRGYGRINVYKAGVLAMSGGDATIETKYSSFALKVKIEPKAEDENGTVKDFKFDSFAPYVFLYDDRGVCVSGGYLVVPDPAVNNKENMNVVEFRGLEMGRYTLKVHSYVYSDWENKKIYKLLDEKTVDFNGDEDMIVEFDKYTIIKI